MGKFKPAERSQTKPVGNTTRTEARVKPGAGRIAQIVFLNGANSAEQGNVKQYVNVDPSAEFVDGATVPNIARLGHKPQLEVRFTRPGNFEFTVECVPVSGNANYTSGELSRNSRFGYQKEKKTYKTNGDGSFLVPIDHFFVSAAGGDKYIFRATDTSGTTVSTGILETHRLVHYVEIKMRSLSTCAPNLFTVESEFARYNIHLEKLPEVEIGYMPNGGDDDEAEFISRVTTGFDRSSAPEKRPYVVAITYAGHIATKKANQLVRKLSVAVGPGSPPAFVPVAADEPPSPLPKSYFLWQGIVPGENWLISAKYIKQGDGPSNAVTISADKCAAMLDNNPSLTYANVVRVDVSDLPPGIGTLELSVNVVDKMSGGFAFTGGNVICVGTQAWWSPIDAAAQKQIIIHELGHIFGLVADGSGKLPDKASTFYENSQGHNAPHCYSGLSSTQLRYDLETDVTASKCVMYGATNGITTFCVNCAPSLRKVDLSDGRKPL